MLSKNKLTSLYELYGFEVKGTINKNIMVFALHSGHYYNADVVPLTNDVKDNELDEVFNSFKKSGYACKVRKYESIEKAEKELFKGFFNLDVTRAKLKKTYEEYTKSVVSVYSNDAEYKYINSKYYINDKEASGTLIENVGKKISSKGSVLFLIEAAAGYGKTSCAFELVNYILEAYKNTIPLFTELSRNRKAKIFRYVLLDEIERSFPLLRSSLVSEQIKQGNVPVILDGFDELLHENDDYTDYEKSESMLETISQYLVDDAKVILTTRRTAIFDGDKFHEWIEEHKNDFDVVRIRIDQPSVKDWLSEERYELIQQAGFPIKNLSNPVLLSFLRCIPDKDYKKVIKDTTKIVDRYFESMLDREMTRQDLKMTPEGQYAVLKSLAKDMIDYNYTSESKENIAEVILQENQALLEITRKNYSADTRPTLDELVNKLSNHAYLDKQTTDNNIGFVNEFVLGNFSADIMQEHPENEWSGEGTFIEPAVLSYVPRSDEEKKKLWNAIKFANNFLDVNEQILNDIRLNNKLTIDILGEGVNEINFEGLAVAENTYIKNSVFSNCIFRNVTFNLENITGSSFVECLFYDCEVEGIEEKPDIYFYGCTSNNEILNQIFDEDVETDYKSDEVDDCDIFVLRAFKPVGSEKIHKHRPIKAICSNHNKYSPKQIFKSIQKLKKMEYLLTPDKKSFVEFNFEYVSQIKEMLGE